MKILIPIIALGLFIWLACYSQNPCVKYPLADACIFGAYTPVKEINDHEAFLIRELYGV